MALRILYLLFILANLKDSETVGPKFSKKIENVAGSIIPETKWEISGEGEIPADVDLSKIKGIYESGTHISEGAAGSVIAGTIWSSGNSNPSMGSGGVMVNHPNLKWSSGNSNPSIGSGGVVVNHPNLKWSSGNSNPSIGSGGIVVHDPHLNLSGLKWLPDGRNVYNITVNVSKVLIPGMPTFDWSRVTVVGMHRYEIEKKMSSNEWSVIPIVGTIRFGSFKITGSGGSGLPIGEIHPLCQKGKDCHLISWKVQLGQEFQLTAIQMKAQVNLNGFTVEIGTDEGNVAPCGEYKTSFATTNDVMVVCSRPIKGNFINILMRDPEYDHNVMKNTEIRLIGVHTAVIKEYELLLFYKYTFQMGTYAHFISDFAIDGNLGTCAISTLNCNTFGCQQAWWQIDIGNPKTVSTVQIYTCDSDVYVNTLQEITVGVGFTNEPDKFTKCVDFAGDQNMRPRTWISLVCGKPAFGKYVTIRRQTNARNNPGMIALAEVKIFVLEQSTDHVLKPIPIDPNYIKFQVNMNIWMVVSLTGSVTQQISTYKNHLAQYAIDGLLQTYSLSCTNCDGGHGGVAWWQITLVETCQVTAVQLISSMDVFESNLLQEFVVTIALRENSVFETCFSYSNRTEIRQGTTISVVCNNPINGRIVKITRDAKSKLMPEKLAISEITIYAIKVMFKPPATVSPIIESFTIIIYEFTQKVDQKIWIVISITTIISFQSGTIGDHSANMATDGDLGTYAVATADINQVAWWKMQFDSSLTFTAFVLISSPNYFDSNTLQEFIVTISDKTKEYQCAEFRTHSDIPPLTSIPVACLVPIAGYTVMVRRLPDSIFKKEMLVITEINVYVDRRDLEQPDLIPPNGGIRNETEVKYDTSYERNSTFPTSLIVNLVELTFFYNIDESAIRDIYVYIIVSENIKALCNKYDRTEVKPFDHLKKIKFQCLPPQTGTGINVIVTHVKGANAELLIIKTHTTELPKAYERKLKLNGPDATQSGGNTKRPAWYAVDINLNTASQATPERGTTAWWMIDMRRTYKVVRVVIYASSVLKEANTLRKLSIKIMTKTGLQRACMDFSGDAPKPSQSKNYKCNGEIEGNFVKIINARHGEYLYLAEVEIYVSDALPWPAFDEQEIPTSNKPTGQIGTFIYHISDFAVDGNPGTCAIACNPCNEEEGEGWWKIFLNGPRNITGVEITPCNASVYSETLQQITVMVTENQDLDKGQVTKCGDYNGQSFIDPSSVIKVKCLRPTVGRYIVVKRQSVATYRRGTIAIAEIKIFETTDNPPETVLPFAPPVSVGYIKDQVTIGLWIEIPLDDSKITISGNPSNEHRPEMSIDRNVLTFTFIDTGHFENPAWWKITLKKEFEIVAVSVMPNNDPNEANYLQEIIVKVGQSYENDLWDCGSYINRTMHHMLSPVYVVCKTPIKGSIVMIQRAINSKYMANRLVITEVVIYGIYPGPAPTLPPPITENENRIIITEVGKGFWIEIILIEHYVYQSGTLNPEHGAPSGVDGDTGTIVIACNPCNDVQTKHPAWFQIQFSYAFYITAVELIASPNSWETNTLQDFKIIVGYHYLSYECAEFSTNQDIPIGATISVLCKTPVQGNILKVERLPDSKFKKNFLIFAEIKVYSMKIDGSEKDIDEKWKNGTYLPMPLFPSGVQWIFSYEETYAFGCPESCGAYFIEESEWIILFNGVIEVAAVQITFSEYYQPQYLTDLEVKVGKKMEQLLLCSKYNKDTPIRNKITLFCNQPIKGRVITIYTRIPVSSTTVSLQIYDVKVYTVNVNQNVIEEIRLPTTGLHTEQSTTPIKDRPAGNAIDGIIITWSETDTMESPGGSSVGWWKVDMKVDYYVTKVLITSASDLYYAYYLQMFDVIVITGKGVEKTCANYRDAPFEPQTTKELRCNEPQQGRYLCVRKIVESYKKQAIMIAEIEIFVQRRSGGSDTTEVEIPVINKIPTQTGTFIYHIAEFAIDGNLQTCAVACNPCDDRTGFGWWQIYLGQPRTISRLEIYACNTRYYAKMLTQITVGISDYATSHWDKFTKCADYNGVGDIEPNSMINVKCHKPTMGRYVTIIRQKVAIHRPESISIAEVKIFEITENPIETVPPIVPPVYPGGFLIKIERGEWVMVITINAKPSQAGTKDGNDAGRAIDRNPFTIIISVSESNNQPAWWKIELDKMYHIVGVIITSSNDYFNSNLLQEFVVEVGLGTSIRICSHYRNITDIPRGSKIYLICNTPLLGNIVIVSRSPNSRFHPGMLSFAEIEIYFKVEIQIIPSSKPNQTPFTFKPPTKRITQTPTIPGPKFEVTIMDEVGKNNWFVIEITEQIIYHSGTMPNHDPRFSLDGDPNTFAVICNPCGEEVIYVEYAWIKYEFSTIFHISAVELTSSPSYESNTLQDFVILVGFGHKTDPICAVYKHFGTVYPGTRIHVLCSSPMSGKVLTIERMPNSNYKKGLLVIAEIVFYAAKVDEDISIEVVIETKVIEGIWVTVFLQPTPSPKPGGLACQFCGHYQIINEALVIFLMQRVSVVAVQLQYTANCDVEAVVGDAIERGRVCSRFQKSNDKNNVMHISILCDQPYSGQVVTIRKKSIEHMVIEVIGVQVYVLKPTGSISNPQGELLPMTKLTAAHSGQVGDRAASNAIDGNTKTWSQSSPYCPRNSLWWRVDLGNTYEVLGVTIVGPNDLLGGYDLQRFQITVMSKLGDFTCYSYDGEPFDPEEAKYFPCMTSLKGEGVLIKKSINTCDDTLSLGEVQVHVTTLHSVTEGKAEGNATAIGSLGFHVPQFALDGDSRTCAISCFPCSVRPSRGYEYGWWQYDFGRPRTVSAVHILTCNTQEDANYLLDIVIGVSNSNVTNAKALTKCHQDETSHTSLAVNQWLNYKCAAPVTGRYLLIKRNTNANYKPDVIALAEIKFEEKPGTYIDVTIRTNALSTTKEAIQSKLAQKTWFKIPLRGLTTSQAGTFSNYRPEYASDNNPSTFSVACNPCGFTRNPGWWRIQLGRKYTIVAVELMSSPEEFYSNILQEFVIEVGDGRLKGQTCVEYFYPTYVPPLTTISVECQKPVEGNALTVKRKLRSSFRNDAVAIAEITIYTSNNI